jgi:hypothetical protein
MTPAPAKTQELADAAKRLRQIRTATRRFLFMWMLQSQVDAIRSDTPPLRSPRLPHD